MDVLLLHARAVHLDGFDADFGLVGEKDEHLIGGVVVVRHQNNQIGAGRPFFAGLVAELLFELFECLVQLLLCNQIATIMAQLEETVCTFEVRFVMFVFGDMNAFQLCLPALRFCGCATACRSRLRRPCFWGIEIRGFY